MRVHHRKLLLTEQQRNVTSWPGVCKHWTLLMIFVIIEFHPLMSDMVHYRIIKRTWTHTDTRISTQTHPHTCMHRNAFRHRHTQTHTHKDTHTNMLTWRKENSYVQCWTTNRTADRTTQRTTNWSADKTVISQHPVTSFPVSQLIALYRVTAIMACYGCKYCVHRYCFLQTSLWLLGICTELLHKLEGISVLHYYT